MKEDDLPSPLVQPPLVLLNELRNNINMTFASTVVVAAYNTSSTEYRRYQIQRPPKNDMGPMKKVVATSRRTKKIFKLF